MVVLVEIAGTDEQYLTEGMSLAEILDGYNKYSQATTIYDEFNSNLPDGFLGEDLEQLFLDLAQESDTPEGPSYTNQNKTDDGLKLGSEEDGPQSQSAIDDTTIDAIRVADYMSGYAPLAVKAIGAVIGHAFTDPTEEQEALANAIDTVEDTEKTFEERQEQLGTLMENQNSYTVSGKSMLGTAALGFLGNPAGLASGIMGAATKSKVGALIDRAIAKSFENLPSAAGADNYSIGSSALSDPFSSGFNTYDASFTGYSTNPADPSTYGTSPSTSIGSTGSTGSYANPSSYSHDSGDNSSSGSFNGSSLDSVGDLGFDSYDGDSGSGYSSEGDSGGDDDNGGNGPGSNSGASRGAGNGGR